MVVAASNLGSETVDQHSGLWACTDVYNLCATWHEEADNSHSCMHACSYNFCKVVVLNQVVHLFAHPISITHLLKSATKSDIDNYQRFLERSSTQHVHRHKGAVIIYDRGGDLRESGGVT